MDMEVRNRWRLIFFELLVLSFIFSYVTSESPKGFISIDCGGTGGPDSDTRLDWDTDEDYLQNSKQLSDSNATVKATVYVKQDSDGQINGKQLQSAMVFFPEASDHAGTPRSKFCYELPVIFSSTEAPVNYLLRATFPSSNFSGAAINWDAYSTRFYYSVDSTYIATIELQDESAQTIELIVSPLDTALYVCLIPVDQEDRRVHRWIDGSMAAISSLELRPLDQGMDTRFSSNETGSSVPTYLITFARWNFRGNHSHQLRYPHDQYDRIWSSRVLSDPNSSVISAAPRTLRDDAKTVQILSSISAPALDRSGDPCLPVPWAWIMCNVETPPRVTYIKLADKNISSLPESFGVLNRLTTLDLSDNNLSGSLSPLLRALDTSITHLNLRNNSFNGFIDPTLIAKLVNLEYLDLSYNQLSGNLDFDLLRSLKKLKILYLDGNNFTAFNLTTWYECISKAKNCDSCEKCGRLSLGEAIKDLYFPPRASPQNSSNEIKFCSKECYSGYIWVDGRSPWCRNRFAHVNVSSQLVEYLCGGGAGYSSPPVVYLYSIFFFGLGPLGITISICVFVVYLCKIIRKSRELDEIQRDLARENVKPPFFSYYDLKAYTRNFSSSAILGKGGFGTVYKADLPDGKVLAVKKLEPTEQNVADFFKEVVNITGIKHRHLIQLMGCCVRDNQRRLLIYEYAENRSLAEALWGQERPFVLSWKRRFNICLGVARGLSYLHEELQPTIIHRDIKPQNILLDKDYNAKIADFGLIRPARTEDFTSVTSNIAGTKGYLSPEYAIEGIVSEKLDVYSFGVVLLEIVSGKKCLDRTAPEDSVYLRDWAFRLPKEEMLISLLDKELTEDHNEEEVVLVLEIALACCQYDWAKRPTMTQVVNKLMKHSDVAIDIVPGEDIVPQPLPTVDEDELEESSLPASSSTLAVQGSSSTIELANMLHGRRHSRRVSI
ncbi:hypothetical protein R1flu_002312 [Riccia fluitans]|uniref:non-specific serine/threonine protein kinase n=1 Tax=Riccia fluitans TaxID=41844 RepID=A0ABD1Y5R7_9MARC